MTLLGLVLADLRADRVRSIVAVAAVVPIVFAHLVLIAVAGTLGDAGSDSSRALVLLSTNPLDPSTGRLDETTVADALDAAGGDIASATPIIFRPADADGSILQLRAAALDAWEPVIGLGLLEGRLPAPGADEMAMTEGVAAATGWRTGDVVEIFGTDFTITALVRAPGTKFASLWMSFDRADRLFELGGTFQMVSLHLAPGADPEAVREAVSAVSDGRYSAYFEDELTELQSAGLQAASDLSILGTVIGVSVLAFGAFNLTSIALAERSPDLGVARVIGIPRRALSGFAALRSMVLAACGFVVGAAGAYVFVALQEESTLRSFVLEPRLGPVDLAIGAVVTLSAGLIGGWLAARRAAAAAPRQLLEGR